MSSNKDRKRQKRNAKKKKIRAATAHQPKVMNPQQMMAELNRLFDPAKLVTPSEVTTDITQFCQTISSSQPFFIDANPEPWSRQSCCEQNVEEYIKANGGKPLYGYKIWAHLPHYIEAERHAIWKSGDELRDVSFNSDGEPAILFLPDEESRQGSLDDNEPRHRWGKDAKTKQLIAFQSRSEEFANIQRMSKEESWNTMLTYEEWQAGRRMSNIVQKPVA